ncbi:uncharacterized protein KGF55_000265 [Candida pseudojiufengensis]|uniref:uncharacterized protein n=1 Tax=Candida pseudojiufengensis TaxID=497109 RepID=UPI0022241A01|nr:uncharacterized protein KGF55_000265 [Candida pseudojiufengensis]KAI5966856.1 hypothetical protein KGF55_000265 [Candida pseudojiufengensis]
MEIFLKLPKEILSLIFSNIKDKSIIKSLINIPGLQHIALERKYPKFEINNGNKSIESLIELFQQYEFIPSIIIGNVKQINQLINEPNFRSVNYEVKILKTTGFNDLVSILDKVYIVGVHLDQYLERFVGIFKKNEIKSFLNFVENTFLQSLTTSHLDIFTIQFPKSLKQLTLDKGHKINLDISHLHHLESFDCKNLHKMSTLDNLQLPLSIKSLRLYSCAFTTLGDLSKYNNLKLLHISCCHELYDVGYTSFPNSLKTMNFINNFQRSKIDELLEEGRFDFSYLSQVSGLVCIGDEFWFRPNLKNLKICDTTHTLDVGNISVRTSLDILELHGIGFLNLNEVIISLPKKMSKIVIKNCHIAAEGHVEFPESERIHITDNDIWSKLFETSLNQLKSMKVLDMSDNYSSDRGFLGHLNPLELLINLKKSVFFNSPSLLDLTLKSLLPMKYEPYELFSSSPVSFECKNLIKLKMISLGVELLDLDQFPSSLEELIINNLSLETMQGNFSNLNNLKKLDLQNNQITFSMLSSQKFPSSLTHLNLSDNEIEDLSCLVLDNCVNLKDLQLEEVTSKCTPGGVTQLRNLFSSLNSNIDAILTNYDSEVIFEYVNGDEKDSILKSNYKKRRIC